MLFTRAAQIAAGVEIVPITHGEKVLMDASVPTLSARDRKNSGKYAKKAPKKSRKKAKDVQ